MASNVSWPRGYLEQQLSSRSYGLINHNAMGREEVTKEFFDTRAQVKMPMMTLRGMGVWGGVVNTSRPK